jgi:autotransporter-associated beta strand protein
LSVTSGSQTGSGGAGGAASFTAGTLSAQTINLTKNNGTLSFNVTNLQIGAANTALTATGLAAGDATITNLLLTGVGNFTLSGANVSVGQLIIDDGTLNNTNWTNLVGGGVSYSTTNSITLGAGGATVNLGTGEDKTLDRVLTGAGGLTKTGAGTLTLSGANTYTGGTTITGGTLQVDGSIASSGLTTVNSGGTLSGSGMVGDTEVNAGGTLSPGDAPGAVGTLSIAGDLNMQDNSTLHIDYNGTQFDKVSVTGTADVDTSTLNLVLTGGNLQLHPGDRVTLIAAGTLTGNFPPKSGMIGGYPYTLEKDGNNLILLLSNRSSATAIPATSGGVLIALGVLLMGLGMRSRRKGA